MECTCGFSCGSEAAFERHQRRFADSSELHVQTRRKNSATDELERPPDEYNMAVLQQSPSRTPARQVCFSEAETPPSKSYSGAFLGTASSPIARARGALGGKSEAESAADWHADEAERWAAVELKRLRERVDRTMDRTSTVMTKIAAVNGSSHSKTMPVLLQQISINRLKNSNSPRQREIVEPPVPLLSEREIELLKSEASKASEFQAEAKAAQKEFHAFKPTAPMLSESEIELLKSEASKASEFQAEAKAAQKEFHAFKLECCALSEFQAEAKAAQKEFHDFKLECCALSEFQAEAEAARKGIDALQLECRRFRIEAQRAESIAAAERGRAAKMQSELEAQTQQVAAERLRAMAAEKRLASQVAVSKMASGPEVNALRRESSGQPDPIGWEQDLLSELPNSNANPSLSPPEVNFQFPEGRIIPRLPHGIVKSFAPSRSTEDRSLPRFGAEPSLAPIYEARSEGSSPEQDAIGSPPSSPTLSPPHSHSYATLPQSPFRSPEMNGFSPSERLDARVLTFDSPASCSPAS